MRLLRQLAVLAGLSVAYLAFACNDGSTPSEETETPDEQLPGECQSCTRGAQCAEGLVCSLSDATCLKPCTAATAASCAVGKCGADKFCICADRPRKEDTVPPKDRCEVCEATTECVVGLVCATDGTGGSRCNKTCIGSSDCAAEGGFCGASGHCTCTPEVDAGNDGSPGATCTPIGAQTAAPTLMTAAPSRVCPDSGKTLYLYGTNLKGDSCITIGGKTFTAKGNANSTEAQAVLPDGIPPGDHVATLTTAGGSATIAFTITGGTYPTITSYAPMPAVPGQKLTLTGKGLVPGTTLNVCKVGSGCKDVAVTQASGMTLELTWPADAQAGEHDVYAVKTDCGTAEVKVTQ